MNLKKTDKEQRNLNIKKEQDQDRRSQQDLKQQDGDQDRRSQQDLKQQDGDQEKDEQQQKVENRLVGVLKRINVGKLSIPEWLLAFVFGVFVALLYAYIM